VPTHTAAHPHLLTPPPPTGSITSEYKSKARTLAFNLKDPTNPDLRSHVLAGDIPPPTLVTMSAADLASKDVAEFRRRVEEEHNKAIELDPEAAAKVRV
jgi:hypothetical protein